MKPNDFLYSAVSSNPQGELLLEVRQIRLIGSFVVSADDQPDSNVRKRVSEYDSENLT